MSGYTQISWADKSWNPMLGCDRVSPGCDGCYAIGQAHIRASHPNPKIAGAFAGTTARVTDRIDWTGKVNLLPGRLADPLGWRKPARIFVNSMSDLFHADVPDEFIASTFAVMALAPWHTFQVLTKRHARMRSLLSSDVFTARVSDLAYLMAFGEHPQVTGKAEAAARATYLSWESVFPSPSVVGALPWPLPSVWLGVSVEDQHWADIRIPALMQAPAAVRWISAEPLLGPIDLRFVEVVEGCTCGGMPYGHERGCGTEPGPHWGLDWVVVGGESGPGARPMDPDWVRVIRDRCAADGVAFHFKQWGALVTEDQAPADIVLPSTSYRLLGDAGPSFFRVGKGRAGRELDGRTHDEYPAVTS